MSSDPKWLSDMRDHFQQTGSYRIEDVYRVLGDPLVTVTLPFNDADIAVTATSDKPLVAPSPNDPA